MSPQFIASNRSCIFALSLDTDR